MVYGVLSLVLSSVRIIETYVERVLSLQFRDQSFKRLFVYFYFFIWFELCVCCFGWQLGIWGFFVFQGGEGWGGFLIRFGLKVLFCFRRGLFDSFSNLLRFIQEVYVYYLYQRFLYIFIVVYCRQGVGSRWVVV